MNTALNIEDEYCTKHLETMEKNVISDGNKHNSDKHKRNPVRTRGAQQSTYPVRYFLLWPTADF